MSRFYNFTIYIVVIVLSAKSRCGGTSDRDRHECIRPCVSEPLARKLCRYEFFVSELSFTESTCNESKVKDDRATCGNRIPLGNFLGINGNSPGPSIEVCLGDTIEVLLYNKLGTEELSLHWHGLRQKDSNHLDGVPMITQCPVLPHGGFRYKIKPESTGTFFYHAHSVSQQGDGAYGSLTVRGPQDDPTLERILLVSSRPPTPLTRHSHLYPPTPRELLVNGQNSGPILRVQHGERHLLRLINANAYNCPILFSTSAHVLEVLAADGNPVQPTRATRIIVFPGERFDIAFEANQPAGKYIIDVEGLQDCESLHLDTFILYENVTVHSPLTKDPNLLKSDDHAIAEKGFDCKRISKDFACALDLVAQNQETMDEDVAQTIYIPFDINTLPSFTDDMTDNSYKFYGCIYYPAYLSVNRGGTKIAQINGVSFKYPSSPILSQPEDVSKESLCSLEERSIQCADTPLFCECTQMIQVPFRKTIEIILINEGFGGNTSYTFHLHGYGASIVGRDSFEQPITKQDIISLDRYGKLKRNLVNPPRKDTFTVPNKGYVILRFYTDNLGYWLWESRSTGISPGTLGPAMQFLMRVGPRESFPPVPLNFPTCGNNKGPDLIFEAS